MKTTRKEVVKKVITMLKKNPEEWHNAVGYYGQSMLKHEKSKIRIMHSDKIFSARIDFPSDVRIPFFLKLSFYKSCKYAQTIILYNEILNKDSEQ